MSLGDIQKVFKEMGPEERAALQELKAAEVKRLGRDVSIGDIIRAVTPGMETPEYLR